jgi:hypothetical protein
MSRWWRVLALVGLSFVVVSAEASAHAPWPPADGLVTPSSRLGDETAVRPIAIGAATASLPSAGPRLALPPGTAIQGAASGGRSIANQTATEVWRVDDGTGALRANLAAGPEHGLANRFDPADFWDTQQLAPRPLRIHKIHFLVAQGEPTGPVEWHVWEDNGGHKPDPAKETMSSLVVTGGPGENVIDLDALGQVVLVDPPRMFNVGVAHKQSDAGSPDIMLDDGLPYVGDTGDFHASLTAANQECGGWSWYVLATDAGDGKGTRSPVWMIWLEVEWLPAPTQRYFDAVVAGDFGGASRIAWGDYNRDGREDILADGSTLYRNNDDGTFSDVTKAAGITDSGSGAIWGDYDNDGHLDFYQYTVNCVPCGQADNFDDLWHNNGDGTFTNVRDHDFSGDPSAPVPRDPLPTEAAVWADFNGDGYLDLYAANHVDWASGACFDDYLWLNSGPPDYTFRDASVAAGIRTVRWCGRGVNAADFDDDGDVDVFVADYRLNPDLLWVNSGNDANGVPRFVNQARQRGVEGRETVVGLQSYYGHSIGAAWGDINRDGALDLVAARLAHSAWLCFSDITGVYESSGPSGGHTFANRRAEAGVAYNEVHSEPSLVDFDNDGHLDLHITQVYDGWRSVTYRSEGTTPASFEDVTAQSGIWPRSGWGSGWADYDRDGDLDLAARGFWCNRARPDSPNHWLQVDVSGCGPSNRDGIGTKIHISYRSATQRRDVVGGRGTGSQDSSVQHFGLGTVNVVNRVTIAFPSGQTQTLANVAADQRLAVTEVGAYVRSAPSPAWVGRPAQLIADTCGAASDVRWDLDNDGQFDDGTGAITSTTFPQAGQYPVAAQISDGRLTVVARATVAVATFIPTATPPPTAIPWPTAGPSPTVDTSHFVRSYLPVAMRQATIDSGP